MLRKLSLFFAFAIFLVPTAVAVAAPAPEFNPICWKKEECDKQRAALNSGNAGKGFLPNDPPCIGGQDADKPWGKCLPANITQTEISFGGKSSFVGLGEFIKYNYNLAIGVASILAAIMIVMAGFQWAASGGNADTIAKAKKRITGAVTGLVLAYTSYLILSTISPDLVSLRLPQAYMVKPGNIVPKFCFYADKTTKFSNKVAEPNSQSTMIKTDPTLPKNLNWMQVNDRESGVDGINCGARYAMDTGDTLCYGSICAPGKTCTNLHSSNPSNTDFGCEDGSVFGIITNSSFTGCVAKFLSGVKTYSYKFISNAGINGIYKVCKNDTPPLYTFGDAPVAKINDPISLDDRQQQYFSFPIVSDASEDCGSNSKFLGYVIGLKIAYNCSAGSDTRLVDKTGRDLGFFSGTVSDEARMYNVNGYYSNTQQNLTSDNLISASELRNGGVVLMIDTANFQQSN